MLHLDSSCLRQARFSWRYILLHYLTNTTIVLCCSGPIYRDLWIYLILIIPLQHYLLDNYAHPLLLVIYSTIIIMITFHSYQQQQYFRPMNFNECWDEHLQNYFCISVKLILKWRDICLSVCLVYHLQDFKHRFRAFQSDKHRSNYIAKLEKMWVTLNPTFF